MDHQVTHLNYLSWTCSRLTRSDIKFVTHDRTPPSNGGGINYIRFKHAPKTPVIHMKKWPKCPRSPLLLHYLSSSWCTCGLMGHPLHQITGHNTWHRFIWVCVICRHNPQMDSWDTQPLLGALLKGSLFIFGYLHDFIQPTLRYGSTIRKIK